MGRRTSGQTVGLQAIGNVQANAATLTTTQNNQDLSISPNGTGIVVSSTDITIANQRTLRLRESSGNGTNHVAMRAAASLAADYTLTWPNAVAGGNGFVLSSDTSGNLSWVSAGGSISVSDPGPSAVLHFPLFATNGGIIPTTLDPRARTNLSFLPSTGELFSDIARHPNIIGSAGNAGTITIRGTSSATKATASVLLTDGVASTTTSTGTLVVTGGVGVSGQVTCTTLVETSSAVYKENITPIENALDLVTKLVGVTYDRKDNHEHEAGLIAEEVYKLAPDLVSLDKNGKPYGIKYTKITAYLIESIKKIKEEIDLIKGKN